MSTPQTKWLNVQPQNIPAEIQEHPQWLLWKATPRDNGKWGKPPCGIDGRAIDKNDTSKHMSFADAMTAYHRGGFDGIGFVTFENDPFVLIDLDGVIDAAGNISADAAKIVAAIGSYTEVSPSGTGLRIVVKGALDKNRRSGGVEAYYDRSFLTISGHPIPGSPGVINQAQAALDAFVKRHFDAATPVEMGPDSHSVVPAEAAVDDTDAELLAKIVGSAQGFKFSDLWAGDWEGHYTSQSEAELSLCSTLAFWCQKDPEEMDRLFRKSKLMRSKWDEQRGKHTYGGMTIQKAIIGCPAVYAGEIPLPDPRDWSEPPIPLAATMPPRFSASDFPPVLWRMIEAVSLSTETPPELAGSIGVAVAAACCQRKAEVEVSCGYREPLNLWTCSVLPPGSRKSAVLRQMLAPVILWERDAFSRAAMKIQLAEAKREAEEQRLKELQRRFAKENDPTKREALAEEISKARLNLTPIPKRPQVVCQDVTPEKLGTLLSDQGGKMALFSAEGGIFETIAGRYSNGTANLDLFLQAHSGDDVRVDRGNREPIRLERPALTMGLTVQPEVLTALAGKQGFRGRGFIGRCHFILPMDNVGKRSLVPRPVPKSVQEEYDTLITALLDRPIVVSTEGAPPVIRLSGEASILWRDFQRWVETEMAEGGSFENCRDYGGKLAGAAARIAGVFHYIDHKEDPAAFPVTAETMRRAVSLAGKLAQHALAAFDVMGVDADVLSARKVLCWIERHRIAMFTGRDVHRALRGSFPQRKDLDPGLRMLEERGWIRRTPDPKSGPGRKSPVYEVHPAAHERQSATAQAVELEEVDVFS